LWGEDRVGATKDVIRLIKELYKPILLEFIFFDFIVPISLLGILLILLVFFGVVSVDVDKKLLEVERTTVAIVALIFSIAHTIGIIGGFRDEIKEIWSDITKVIVDIISNPLNIVTKFDDYTPKLSFRAYTLASSLAMSIPIVLCFMMLYREGIQHLKDYLLSTVPPSDYFIDIAGILGTIVSILIAISWIVIQRATEAYSNILMWQWVRDRRFILTICITFNTIFLLMILRLVNIEIYTFVYGILYYLIFLNFVLYILHLKVVLNIVNPKHAIDLILKSKDLLEEIEENKENNKNSKDKSLLSDEESRLYAVYEIIKKGIKNKDVYLVVKCLEMIDKNFDEYWVFKNENGEYNTNTVKIFLKLIIKLRKMYEDEKEGCANEPFFDRGLEAFNNITKNIIIKICKENDSVYKCGDKLGELLSPKR
jgi:hypothetical protein